MLDCIRCGRELVPRLLCFGPNAGVHVHRRHVRSSSVVDAGSRCLRNLSCASKSPVAHTANQLSPSNTGGAA